VHALLHHLEDLSGIGGELRPGIVHRLDRDTSGLMVVAKNDRAHRALSGMLARREIRRSYKALVWGSLESEEGVIEGAIGRDPRHRQRMAVREEGGKMAVTRYSRLESLPDFDYIRLDLETGRTHQIRVHLSWLGHPVLGDPLYGGRKGGLKGRSRRETERMREVLGFLDRQALHAYRLAFSHPVTDRPLEFESPLPADFRRALERLRQP
jgi:23S rRNA pseudouridine1911/1915/1917 synthase